MYLKRLKYFIAVAEELNIGRAATRLDIAQPPLSRQIALLEEELGVHLFDRSRSQIQLTQAGCVLRDRAREIIERLELALSETKRIGSGLAGRLSIGFVGSASYSVLPALIRSYRREYPDVHLSLREMNNASLQRSLVQREIDVAVARPGLEDDEFRKEPLCVEKFILALPEGSDLGGRDTIRIADLTDQTIILSAAQSRPSYGAVILDILSHEGVTPRNTELAPDFQSLISLVSVGVGIAFVPQSLGLGARPGLILRPYEGYNPGIGLMVHTRLDNRAPQVMQFMDLTRRFARKL